MSVHALANDLLSTAVPLPGTILADAYRVDGVLANGGMGVILAATELAAQRRVAIKIMTAAAASDPEHVARFRREAKAASSLSSQHVVRVLDFGELDSGLPYLVMEHLEGTALVDVIKLRGPLPVAEAVDYVVQAIHGVAEAHACGIVHRDLKPANLFVTGEPDAPIVKILDFGASKLTAESSIDPSDPGGVTLATSLIGSPRYMAPEQIRSALDVDARADIYALGASLHELLSGKPIFFSDTLARIFALVLWESPTPLSTTRDDVPAALQAVIARCLAKAPEDRYATVEALAAALSPFATTTATPRPPSVATDPPSGRVVSVPRRPLPHPASGSKLVASRLFRLADPSPSRVPTKRPVSALRAAVVIRSTKKMPRVKMTSTPPKRTVRMAAFALAAHLTPAPAPGVTAVTARTVQMARYQPGPQVAPRRVPRALIVAIAIVGALVLLAVAVQVGLRLSHAKRATSADLSSALARSV